MPKSRLSGSLVCFDNTTKPHCPFCGREYKGQLPILNFYYAPAHGKFISENYRLMIYDKQTLYRWHSNNLVSANEKTSDNDKKPVGDFHFHNGQWILINRRLPDMRDITEQKIFQSADMFHLQKVGRFSLTKVKEVD